MTIRELLAILQNIPEELIVYRQDSEWGPQTVAADEVVVEDVEDSYFDKDRGVHVCFKRKAAVIG